MLGSTMAMPGNETHRFPVQGQPRSPLSSARPLKSSPLAGPAVIVSLIDGTLSSTPAPARPLYLQPQQRNQHDLPVRPKSVHHALTHRSRSISAQSSSRPVSLYAYCPSGPGVVNGNGGGNSTSGHGSPHGSASSSGNTQHPSSGGGSLNASADANANNIRRKRPSTAPGPSSTSSFDWAPNTKDEEKKEEQQREEEEIEEMDISESYSSYPDVHPVLTSTQAQAQPQAQDQTLHNANDTDADDRVVRYSPDATSPARPVGSGGVDIKSLTGPTTGGGVSTATPNTIPRPQSILLPESQSTLQPKPILKHHTSFVLSPPPSASSSGSVPGSSMPSLSSSSSRSSFLSTHSSGDIPSISLGPRSSSSSLRSLPSRSQSQTQLRSRSRLSIVSNASCELIKEDETPIPDLPPPSPTKRRLSQAKSEKQNVGATGIQTTTPRPESWYTFSPYATTPRFSRLGLAGSGVVMPVPKREMERALSKRASVVGPAGGIDGQNRENEGGAGLSRSNTNASTKSTSSRTSISSRISVTNRMSRSGSPPPPIPPIPAGVNSSVPISARGQAQTGKNEHLGIPPNVPRSSARSGTTNILTGKSTERSDNNTNSSPSSSSSSSPSCSLSSTDGDRGGESTGASSVSVSNVGIKGEVVVVDVVGEKGASEGLDGTKKDADAKNMEANDASTNADDYKKGHKKNRKSLSESFSGSLKSWRSLRPLRSSAAGAHDVPVPVPPPLPSSAGLPSFGMSGFESAPDLHEVNVHQSVPPAPTAGISTAVHASNPDLSAMQAGTEAMIAPKSTLKKRKSASALLARVKSWRKKRDDTGTGEGVDALKNAGDAKDEVMNGDGFIDTQNPLVIVAAAEDVNKNVVDPANCEGGVVVEASFIDVERPEVENHQGATPEDEDRLNKSEQHAPPIIVIDVVDVDDESDEDKELEVQATQVDPGPTHTTIEVEGESDSSSSSSCDSEYPASTPTSTPSSIHSLPSFVPMCIPIPSPNLHVSSSVSSPSSLPAAVPAFVRNQLSSLSPGAGEVGHDSVQSLNPAMPEPSPLPIPIVESNLISGPGLTSVLRDIVVDHEHSVVDVDVDTDDYADAEEFVDDKLDQDAEELGMLTNRTVTKVDVTPTVVVSHSDRGPCDDVHPIIVPSNDNNDGDDDKEHMEDEDCTPTFANARSLTPPTSDSEDPVVEPASPPSSTPDVVVAHPEPSIPLPVQPPTSTSLPPSSPISPPRVPSSDANITTSPVSITNPSSLSLAGTTKSRGRSQSKGRSKGRSGSVKRIWSAFICGASQAEQMAVEEAWAEIREREQQEAVPQAGHEKKKEKSAMTTVSVVDVEPTYDAPEVVLPMHASVVVIERRDE